MIYFYPKDDTPGCTSEACAFRDDVVELRRMSVDLVGVSTDSVKSHKEFAGKFHLPFPLLSDSDGSVARSYGSLTRIGPLKFAKRHTFLVAPGQRVLEIGCAMGDLLAEVKPALGVGIDCSAEMVKRAAQRHPQLHFIQGDAHNLSLKQTFDVVILSDLLNDLWDVQAVFEEIAGLCTSRTRIVINCYSRLWEMPLALAQRFDLATPVLDRAADPEPAFHPPVQLRRLAPAVLGVNIRGDLLASDTRVADHQAAPPKSRCKAQVLNAVNPQAASRQTE